MNAAIALSGQVAGRIDAIRPIAEIIGETVEEFSKTIDRLSKGLADLNNLDQYFFFRWFDRYRYCTLNSLTCYGIETILNIY